MRRRVSGVAAGRRSGEPARGGREPYSLPQQAHLLVHRRRQVLTQIEIRRVGLERCAGLAYSLIDSRQALLEHGHRLRIEAVALRLQNPLQPRDRRVVEALDLLREVMGDILSEQAKLIDAVTQ